jgi:O-antigen/teichoic acid export membrane protein
VLALAALVAYAADMVCSYLHGLEAAKVAMKINLVGLIASVVLGVPATLAWGLTGACAGLLMANLVRSVWSIQVLAPMLRRGSSRFTAVANEAS